MEKQTTRTLSDQLGLKPSFVAGQNVSPITLTNLTEFIKRRALFSMGYRKTLIIIPGAISARQCTTGGGLKKHTFAVTRLNSAQPTSHLVTRSQAWMVPKPEHRLPGLHPTEAMRWSS